jgi:hypothetical protein
VPSESESSSKEEKPEEAEARDNAGFVLCDPMGRQQQRRWRWKRSTRTKRQRKLTARKIT